MSQNLVYVARYEEGEYGCYATGVISVHRTLAAAEAACDKFQKIQLGHWPYNCTTWVDEMPLED